MNAEWDRATATTAATGSKAKIQTKLVFPKKPDRLGAALAMVAAKYGWSFESLASPEFQHVLELAATGEKTALSRRSLTRKVALHAAAADTQMRKDTRMSIGTGVDGAGIAVEADLATHKHTMQHHLVVRVR